MILNKKTNSKIILYTDECKEDLSPYTKDFIRLDPLAQFN